MYVVNQTCPKCGRKSKFKSTDKVRACPLCISERPSKLDKRVRDDHTISL